MIARYKKIKYRAFYIFGKEITGIGEGFVARVIQHEIDHINGKLCIEKAKEIISIEKYRAMCKAAQENGRKEEQ